MFYLYILLFVSFYKTPSVNANTSVPWARHDARPKLRVINGQDVTTDEYPYVAPLIRLISNRHIRYCTSSILTKNFALTAAHCSKEQPFKKYVWYRNYTVSPLETGAYTVISEHIVHPAFGTIDPKGRPKGNDIALVRFSDINLPSYGRLSAMDHFTMMGLPVKYVGGGKTLKPGKDNIRPLQVGEGAITVCPAIYRALSNILICVAPKCSSRMDSGNNGDSGGPLFLGDKIIGIQSFGDRSPFASITAFAPVSTYLHWVNNIIHST